MVEEDGTEQAEGQQKAKADTDAQGGEGSVEEPQTTPLIDAANAAADRLAAENKKFEDLLNRRDNEAAKQVLGGRAEAGSDKVESDKEYKDRIMRGDV